MGTERYMVTKNIGDREAVEKVFLGIPIKWIGL